MELFLQLSGEQEMLRETTRRFLVAKVPSKRQSQGAGDQPAFDGSYWREGAALGWTSMFVPDACGGGSVSGAPHVELAALACELGRALAPGPLVTSNLAALALVGNHWDEHADVLTGLAAGDLIVAYAHLEERSGWLDTTSRAVASRAGETVVLNGVKRVVEEACKADYFVVSAHGNHGVEQFLVPFDSPGLEVTPARSLDLAKRFGTVGLSNVRLPATARLVPSRTLSRQLDVGAVIASADAVGAANRVFEFTLEYAFNRYSFGRPLASYQALKHRFADMLTQLQACNAVVDAAARELDVGSDTSAAKLASVAKAYVGAHAGEVVQDCVQMHGGIGVTWEHEIHLYLRRVALDAMTFGSSTVHLERVTSILAGAA